jgi:Holliday junction resolvase RusA-like endonuclease
MYTPGKTVAYESLVRLFAAQAMGALGPLAGPVALRITATGAVPASWSQKRRAEALAHRVRPTTKPDIDNIAKAIADGGNGVLWIDDKQIVEMVVAKRYGAVGGVLVEVGIAA